MEPLKNTVNLSKFFVKEYIKPGDVVVDATAGNGKDTLFLAQKVGEKGLVYAFDVQNLAIQRTKSLLKKHGLLERVKLIQDGHENIDVYLSAQKPSCIMFNLGYLPNSDHRIITKPDTTLKALEKSLKLLAPAGIISIVTYQGHPGGYEEHSAVISFTRKIDQRHFSVVHCKFINQINDPPELILIEKRWEDYTV